MSQTEVYWVLFLSPVLLLASCGFFAWIIGRMDRTEGDSAK